MAILRLSDDLWQRCASIARAALPNEACALLAGTVERSHGGSVIVTGVHPVLNELRSPTAFALDGQSMIDAEEAIDASGGQVVGVMHSHPTSEAAPSPRDVRDAQRYDPTGNFVHVIVSMQGFAPVIRGFRYTGPNGAVVEFDLVVADPT
jgi:proteasome lid subunit RPN8/RPN11